MAEKAPIYIQPKRVLVSITRDMTEQLPKLVFEHEVPILEEIHGDVETLNPEEHDVIVPQLNEPIEAGEEWVRLQNVYGMHPKIEMTVAEVVYGRNLRNFVNAAGGPVEPPGQKAKAAATGARGAQKTA